MVPVLAPSHARRLAVLLLSAALGWCAGVALPAAAAPTATVRGQVLLGSQPVAGVDVSLVEVAPGSLISASSVAATSGTDGRFEITGVDGGKRWLLVAWDPSRPGQEGVRQTADPGGANVLRLRQKLHISEPADVAVVVGPRVHVRWEPLPGAARYTLQVEERTRSTKPAIHTVAAPEATIQVAPGHYYLLTLQALDAGGLVIGEDCVPSCSVFQLGVADPEAERRAQPISEAISQDRGARASPPRRAPRGAAYRGTISGRDRRPDRGPCDAGRLAQGANSDGHLPGARRLAPRRPGGLREPAPGGAPHWSPARLSDRDAGQGRCRVRTRREVS